MFRGQCNILNINVDINFVLRGVKEELPCLYKEESVHLDQSTKGQIVFETVNLYRSNGNDWLHFLLPLHLHLMLLTGRLINLNNTIHKEVRNLA